MLAKVFLLLALAPLALAQSGSWNLHLISHQIGEERYSLSKTDNGLVLLSSFEYSDRGMKRNSTLNVRVGADYSLQTFELKGRTATQSLTVGGNQAEYRDGDTVRTLTMPATAFAGIGTTPIAQQMLMMHYWLAHGRPKQLAIVPDKPARTAVIEFVAHDRLEGVKLDRYTVTGLAFGSEVLWLDAKGDLAALMTFASGLPLEAVQPAYEAEFEQLFRLGVDQQMRTLVALGQRVPPEKTGTYAIVGATLVRGTNEPSISDSVVLVRDGRIAAAGPRAVVTIPRGTPVVDAKGKTLLPGLWEMHTHYSGVEFGPATLAAGITTARDCGGEFDLLVAMRDAIQKRNALGPRLLLAGLVDGGGLDAFGAIDAANAEEARAVVAKYRAAGFQQIKLYTVLKPDVIRVLSDEAHRAGMSVTGHVPAAVDTRQGIELGMDQINHLQYVSRMPRTQDTLDFLLQHHTVVDPTASWGEMGGHSKEIEASSFEPGLLKAPQYLAFKFGNMGGNRPSRMKENLALILQLHQAGVPIVAGSDTGLVGYGLIREIELYVDAGMTPLEAIQAATIVPARAMGLDKDTGTVEAGKRADLILIDGNPLDRIANLRRVTNVISNGRMYNAGRLWESVGFRPAE
jgi:imidazolonepropionase-like amidohydrolase